MALKFKNSLDCILVTVPTNMKIYQNKSSKPYRKNEYHDALRKYVIPAVVFNANTVIILIKVISRN